MEEVDEHNSRTLEVEYRWPRIPSRRCDEVEGFGSEIPRRVDPWSYLDGVFALWPQRSRWTEAALPQSLESWSTSPEYRPYFRQKVWGGLSMLSQVTFNREKWLSMLVLDPVTGLDPKGVRVRASEGFDAASSFVQGFWIW